MFANRVTADREGASLAESGKAAAALKDYRTFLNEGSRAKPAGDWKIGADVYNALHEQRYLFDDNDIHLRRIAAAQPGFHARARVSRLGLASVHGWSRRQLEVQASKIDPKRTWLQIIREMKRDHPTARKRWCSTISKRHGESKEWVGRAGPRHHSLERRRRHHAPAPPS